MTLRPGNLFTPAYASPPADDCFLFHSRRTRSNKCHGLKLFSGRFELPARRESSLRVFGFSNGRPSSSPRLPFIGREPIGMPSSRSFLLVCWFTSSIALKRRLGVSPGEVGTTSKWHIQTVRDFLKKRSFSGIRSRISSFASFLEPSRSEIQASAFSDRLSGLLFTNPLFTIRKSENAFSRRWREQPRRSCIQCVTWTETLRSHCQFQFMK